MHTDGYGRRNTEMTITQKRFKLIKNQVAEAAALWPEDKLNLIWKLDFEFCILACAPAPRQTFNIISLSRTKWWTIM